MSGINFVSNTINNQRSIINRRVVANRLAVSIINSPPVSKKVFVSKKIEEVVAPHVEVVKKKPLPAFVTKQIVDYVPAIVDPNAPVVYLKSMN
jgi:hypothetical protein